MGIRPRGPLRRSVFDVKRDQERYSGCCSACSRYYRRRRARRVRRRRCRCRRRRSRRSRSPGRPSQRLNLIILGDGYQWDQQSIFRADVDRNLSVMWATEPFRTYRNYINVYAVEIASIDYGVRCDPDGRVRSRRRDDPRHRRARRADRHQEHRAADEVPERLHRPARARHGLPQRRAGRLQRRRAREVLPARGDLRVRERHPGAQPDHRHLRRARCSASRARRRTSRRWRSSTRSPTAASAAARRPRPAARRRAR